MSLRANFTAVALAAVLTGCQTTPKEIETPPPARIVIHDLIGKWLIDSQNDVAHPEHFTILHDGLTAGLNRYDRNGDGYISSDDPREEKAHRTLDKLDSLGVKVLPGQADMRERIIFNHDTDEIRFHPSQTKQEVALAFTRFLDKHPVFWELEARGGELSPLMPKQIADPAIAQPDLSR